MRLSVKLCQRWCRCQLRADTASHQGLHAACDSVGDSFQALWIGLTIGFLFSFFYFDCMPFALVSASALLVDASCFYIN